MYDLFGATKALIAELNRLKKDQGRVARNNARSGVRAASKRLLAVMDRDYPVIPKEAVKPRRRLSTPVWVRRMQRRGYRRVPASAGALLSAMAVAGVKAIHGPDHSFWVPGWVLGTDADPKKLKEGKRSMTARRAFASVAALRGTP